jgi:hypothetical protein
MKSKLSYGLAVVGLTIALITTLQAQNAGEITENAAGKSWQHLALEQAATKGVGGAEFSRQINRLGNEGWELVDVESVLAGGTTAKRIFFFKRQR